MSRSTAHQLLDITIARDKKIDQLEIKVQQLQEEIHQLEFSGDVAAHQHQKEIETLNEKIARMEQKAKKVQRRLVHLSRTLRRVLHR